MRPDDRAVLVRSFRVCFKLERRIHKVDRWRLPLPYGMPVRGLLYAAAILVGILFASRLPILSSLLGALHPIIRYGALPIAGGYLLTELELDGRTGHAVVQSWVRMQLEPRRLAGFRRAPAQQRVRFASITIGADERGGRLRRGVIDGAGLVVVRQPADMRARGRTLLLSPRPEPTLLRGRQIRLRRGQRVVIG